MATGLSSRIRLIEPEDLSSEDILSSGSDFRYSDRYRNLHGDPGSGVIYDCPRFGEIHLKMAVTEETSNHFLFAHYLWNASLQLAEFITQTRKYSRRMWDVEGQSVLEVGGGAGLAGIVATLSGAKSVTISDYPSSSIIDNICVNVRRNLSDYLNTPVLVRGHQWGVFDDELSKISGKSFTRILCADCIWMNGEHDNLVKTFNHFLAPSKDARVWLIAGFHTGRDVVRSFLQATLRGGFEAEKLWEQDTYGNIRPWKSRRSAFHNDIDERRKWLLITILKRRDFDPLTHPPIDETPTMNGVCH